MAMDSRSSCARGRHSTSCIRESPNFEEFAHPIICIFGRNGLRTVLLFYFGFDERRTNTGAFDPGLIGFAVHQNERRRSVAYYVFLGVVFRSLSVRRSTARRCALARGIGAGGPRDRARTCGGAILTHL